MVVGSLDEESREELQYLEVTGDQVLKYARELGVDHCEVYLLSGTELEVSGELKKLKTVRRSRSRELAVRVLIDGVPGISYTTEVYPGPHLRKLVETAVKVARGRVAEVRLESFPGPGPTYTYPEKIYCPYTATVDLTVLTEYFRTLCSLVREKPQVTGFTAVLSCGKLVRVLLNSEGLHLREARTRAEASLYLATRVGGETGSAEVEVFRRSLRDIDLGKLVCEALTQALTPRRGGFTTGEYPVLLTPCAVRRLLAYTFEVAICADSVQRGRSFLSGKVGSEVATEKLTIIDDPLYPGGNSSRAFDGEGIPSRRTVVIEEGILKTYLHNLTTAKLFGTESTGHAARGTGLRVIVAPTNLVLQFRDTSPLEHLLQDYGKLVLVHSVLGYHTGNPATGEVSVVIDYGLYLERGEVRTGLKGQTLSLTIPQLLRGVEVASREVEMYGEVITPYLIVRATVAEH